MIERGKERMGGVELGAGQAPDTGSRAGKVSKLHAMSILGPTIMKEI